MVSARLQERDREYERKTSRYSDSMVSSPSPSSYASAKGGYESDMEDVLSFVSGQSKWRRKRDGAMPTSSAGGSPGTTTSTARIADWRKRSRATEQGNFMRPDLTTGANTSQEDSWYAHLKVDDDIILDNRATPAPHIQRDETEPLEEEMMMKPAPTYIESNQDLTEALKKLTTSSTPRHSVVQLQTSQRNGERDWSPMSRDRSEPACRQRSQARDRTRSPVSMDAGDDIDSIYEPDAHRREVLSASLNSDLLLQKMEDLFGTVHRVGDAVESMRGELSAFKGRLGELERLTVEAQKDKRCRKKPYTVPQRRPQQSKTRASSVRKEIDHLLNAHDGSPFASREEVADFAQAYEREPTLRCCDAGNFRIDIHGGTRSVWNQSLAVVFLECYQAKHAVSDHELEAVTSAFYTRIKSIKASETATESQKAAKGTYVRKYNLFQRRVEALAESATLRDHLPLLQALSIEGMSSDEEEDLDSSPRAPAVAAQNPRYRVLTPLWRSKELTVFLHLLDSIYLLQRRRNPSKQRGNWARVRAYNPNDLKFSKKTTFPKNLPENAYDKAWLDAFPNPRLSINPAPRYDLSITAETLQYLVAPH